MAEFEKEVAVLVQRVVRDISNAFKKNPNIDEIGIIPCPEPRYNRSPIVLIETKLGLESWCVKFLLPSLHRKLLLYRQRKNYLDREALVDVTVTLLLLNPDFTTAWNIRKELLQCGVLSPEKDLYLGKLALTRFPKSPETWIHRRWVILQVLQQGSRKEPAEGYLCHTEAPGSSQNLCMHQAKLLRQEMSVCSEAAGRYPSNYNAWSHRVWVLQHLAKDNVEVFLEEFSSMRRWVSMHVSDHSGFHYRQFLLQALLTELCKAPDMSAAATPPHQQGTTTPSQSARLPDSRAAFGSDQSSKEWQPGIGTIAQLFDLEMEFCSELIHAYPGHETLWCHRRQVVFLLYQWRRDHPHFPCNTNEGNWLHLSILKDNGQAGSSSSVDKSINGLLCGGDAMEVDGPPDLSDAKLLQGGALTAGSLAAGSLAAGSLAAGSLAAGSLAAGSLAAGSLAAGSLAAGSLAAGSLAAGSLAAGSLAAGSLAAGSLAAGSLAAGSLAAGSLALPAEHSFVSSLLDDCGHPEQRRFALAYRKWLGTISRQ